MRCPFCRAQETKVLDSRLVGEGDQVRRRRECLQCQSRVTTYETPELALPKVIKRDNAREPFCKAKLRKGLSRALEKRPVSVEAIETTLQDIKTKLWASGEREISSERIGRLSMDALKKLDEVAFVRFASVYQRFDNVTSFKQAIDDLLSDDPAEQ